MKSLQDEDLILYYYGEVPEGSEIESQLKGSPELQERYRAVCRLLDAVGEQTVPERHAAYGSRIWHRIAPQIESESRIAKRWTRWQMLSSVHAPASKIPNGLSALLSSSVQPGSEKQNSHAHWRKHCSIQKIIWCESI